MYPSLYVSIFKFFGVSPLHENIHNTQYTISTRTQQPVPQHKNLTFQVCDFAQLSRDHQTWLCTIYFFAVVVESLSNVTSIPAYSVNNHSIFDYSIKLDCNDLDTISVSTITKICSNAFEFDPLQAYNNAVALPLLHNYNMISNIGHTLINSINNHNNIIDQLHNRIDNLQNHINDDLSKIQKLNAEINQLTFHLEKSHLQVDVCVLFTNIF